MVEQIVPQWQILQRFAAAPAPTVQQQHALLVGPNYAVHPYTPTLKSQISIGAYDGTELAVAWPDRAAGEVVDLDWTKVYLERAALRYADILTAGTQTVVSYPNRIRNAAISWAANGTTYPRSGSLPVDVVVGDTVRLTQGASKVYSTVIGLIAEIVAAVTAAAAAVAGNKTTQVASAPVTPTGTSTSVASASASSYDAASVGLISDVYTVTVVTGGTVSGSPLAVSLTVTSASGLDPATTITSVTSATPQALGSKGATIAFGIGTLVAGDTYSVAANGAYTVPTLGSGGTYTGTRDTTYVVRVTKGGGITGGEPSATRAQISVATATDASANGVDVGGPYPVTTAVPVVLGQFGVTLTLTGTSLILNDQFTIVVTAQANGAYKTLVLADALTGGFVGVDLEVETCITADLELNQNRVGLAPATNWTASETEITLAAADVVRNARTGTQDLLVLRGNAYAAYRGLTTALANQVYPIFTIGDALALLGPDTIENPLAYGTYRALENSGGTELKVLPIATDDLDGYVAALSVLAEREDFYRIVPLTFDRAIQDAVEGVVNQRSGDEVGRWVTAMFSLPLVTENPIAVTREDGSTLTATIIDDPDSAGTQYTLVQDEFGQFITEGVRAGFQFRALYASDGFGGQSFQTFIVDAVLGEQSLRLKTGPSSSVVVASKYEIWQALSVGEQAADWAERCATFGNRRITVEFPPNPGRAGTRVPGYYLAASLAALRCASAPQQGLTNAAVTGWDDLKEARDTFGAYLNLIANAGAYIVTQKPAGDVYIRKQLTTDLTDTKHAEDSATVDFDAISYYFKALMAPFVGRSNVVPSNLQLIETAIRGGINYLKTESFVPGLGAMLTDGTVDFVRASPLFLDKVEVQNTLELPIPLNNGIQTLIA